MWVLTIGNSPAFHRLACRHGPHVFNRYLTGIHRAPSSSYGVVVGGGAGSSRVAVIVVAVVTAADAIMMRLMVLVYRDEWWG